MLSNNIDLNDLKGGTSAPFNCQELVKLDNISFDSTWFLSIQLKCTQDADPPVYLDEFKTDEDDGHVWALFKDSHKNTVGVCRLPVVANCNISSPFSAYPGTLVFSSEDLRVPAGHMVYNPCLPDALENALRRRRVDSLEMGGALELLPGCVGIRYRRHPVNVSVNGIQSDTASMKFTDKLQLNRDEDGCYSLNIYDDSELVVPAVKSGIVKIECRNLDEAGNQLSLSEDADVRHLYIEHELDSDVRVVTEGNGIRIIGAKDV